MNDITLLIPSRGRPQQAQAAADSAYINTERESTWVSIVIDKDDPKLEEYLALEVDEVIVNPPPTKRGIVEPLNMAATGVIADREEHGYKPYYIGFIGDDHRIRTKGWDEKIGTRNEVIVYGNDLNQGQNLPTAVFMASDAIKKLGYMAPPELHHLFVDNYWLDLGALTSIKYVPDVVIEHLHPSIGKGKWDQLNTSLNDRKFYSEEQDRYESLTLNGRLIEDAQKVRYG